VAQFELWPASFDGVIPKAPRLHQRAEGSRERRNHSRYARDPSLRLKGGFARDDAIEEGVARAQSKLSHDRKKRIHFRSLRLSEHCSVLPASDERAPREVIEVASNSAGR